MLYVMFIVLCLKVYVTPICSSRKIAKIAKLAKIINFVCVEVLRPSLPNGVMSSAVSLPNHTFTGQA